MRKKYYYYDDEYEPQHFNLLRYIFNHKHRQSNRSSRLENIFANFFRNSSRRRNIDKPSFLSKYNYLPQRLLETIGFMLLSSLLLVATVTYFLNFKFEDISSKYVIMTLVLNIIVNFVFMRKHYKKTHSLLSYYTVNIFTISILAVIAALTRKFIGNTIYTFLFSPLKSFYICNVVKNRYTSILLSALLYLIAMLAAHLFLDKKTKYMRSNY